MIVNKVECNILNGKPYYDLVVSREYYAHDRTWKTVRDIGDSNSCAKRLVGAYFIPAGPDGSGCTGCSPIPYGVPSDSVTPLYEAPCSAHPSIGAHVNQDFQWEPVGSGNTGVPPF